jgi:hypothetical protein
MPLMAVLEVLLFKALKKGRLRSAPLTVAKGLPELPRIMAVLEQLLAYFRSKILLSAELVLRWLLEGSLSLGRPLGWSLILYSRGYLGWSLACALGWVLAVGQQLVRLMALALFLLGGQPAELLLQGLAEAVLA